jgi:hypothetical protein
MTDTACTFENRDDLIVGYLYDDLEPRARHAFEDHVVGCRVCRTELEGLRGVRADLAQWAPPEPARVLALDPRPRRRNRVWAALADVPVWVQVAAALVVLGVSLRAANLQIRIEREGVTVRTGVTAPAESASQSAAPAPAADAPWRADLAALEQNLRSEVQTASLQRRSDADQSRADRSDETLLRRVRALIEASEQNQRRELALRVAEIARDVQAQRTADLQRIQRTFTVLETNTAGEIVKQRQLWNNLAMRVSQQQ